MAQGAGGRGALVCLVLLMIAVMTFAGCTGKEAGEALAEGACEKLSGLDRDHCYQQIAKFNGDGKLCEKIEHPGPKSKCFIYAAETTNFGYYCNKLGKLASGDGAYTFYDCVQYLAVQWQDPQLCKGLKGLGQSGSNDLNPKGISEKTCLDLAGKTCGKIGQKACVDREMSSVSTNYYCMEGEEIGGMCNPTT